MRWNGDTSELNGLQNPPISDILLFGGLAVDAEQEPHCGQLQPTGEKK